MKRKIMTTLLLTLFASAAMAADSAARKQLQQRSAQEGVGVPQVALLQVKAGPGREAALNAVKTRFGHGYDKINFGGTAKTESHGHTTVHRGSGWALEIAGDGKKVRYRNYGYLDGASNRRVPVDQRPAQGALEEKGRRFVAEQLRDLVRLGPGEDLVPLFTEYQVAGGGPTKEGARPDPEAVGAANVVFTRTIDGVHVIGPGSKIAVMFGTDGSVAGFDYDWPEYQRSTRTQKVVSMTEVRERARKLAPEDMGRPDIKAERVECGYFDRGSAHRDPKAMLQSACAIYTVSRPIVDQAAYQKNNASGHLTIAKSTVVPAGETVEPDEKWALAQRHLGRPFTVAAQPKDGPKRTQ